uniref:Double-strand break repair protein n=1 Tax=Cacopsylla melanoneura TaxID=428564 RepID=A0A8D8VIU0_9HEMI
MESQNTEEVIKEDVECDDENSIRIMIATDIHLGYLETDRERGNDSFVTFEEILEHARDKEVDMVLLGGDLFHINKPSPTTLKKCLETLRKHCIGDNSVYIDVISDPKLVMNNNINFLDPNLNIALPVFTINGNHDDPSGPELVAALDIVSNSGLVNYFGKCTNLNEITLHPLIIQKNETKIAIFGLGYVKDERLAAMIKNNKVKYMKPTNDKDIIYILVLHQNRPERGTAKNIAEDSIPSFFHFILWGHEHECRIKPEYNTKQHFHVCQPGSPVATSLCAGEAVQKKWGILVCNKQSYKLKPYDLETVRPFVFENYTVEEDAEHEEEEIANTVDRMIQDSKKQLTGNPRQPKLPLIRLRVENCKTDALKINPIVFGQKYENKVANSNEILLIKNRINRTNRGVKGEFGDGEDQTFIDTCVEDLLKSFYEQAPEVNQLQSFLPSELNESVKRFINQEDRSVFGDIINYKMESIMKHFEETHVKEEDIGLELTKFQTTIAETTGEEFKSFLSDANRTQGTNRTMLNIGSNSEDEMDSSNVDEPPRPARGRGLRGGRGSRGPRGARGKK